ncbi:hypothetical protein [Aquimarina sp. RZ0]|uniref:hypothetical protein n=1 Tax=Aquimarina sp. RZ0 TaxID=2607730 RepID=UPI0011F1C9C6|nr:hypothetical protein [Aquimarina sp. RZ0]KAA1244903.1 hypothetical protein F0000_14270 [Aquimarina sp. RZ0]
MTKGYLSQTIQNIIDHKDHLISLVGLPDKATRIKHEAIELIEENISSIKEMQDDLLEDSSKILDGLQRALTYLKENKNEAIEFINSAHDTAILSKQKLESELQQNIVLKASILKFSQDLQNVLRELQNRNAKLVVDEQKAKDKANKFKKERLYFLALGPFGLVGLATATALFAKWNAKTNTAKKEAAKVRGQINSLKLFQDNVQILQESFSFGIEALSNVKNALDFLSGDIKNIINNTYTTCGDSIVVALYLNAAVKEANVLLIDAA